MPDAPKESLFTKLTSQFNMLWFIMALGFGDTSVAGFAFLINTLPRNPPMKGMLYLDKINEYADSLGGIYATLASYMKVHMLVFGVLCTFVYKHALAYPLAQAMTLLFMVLDVVILLSMLTRQFLKVQGTCCTDK